MLSTRSVSGVRPTAWILIVTFLLQPVPGLRAGVAEPSGPQIPEFVIRTKVNRPTGVPGTEFRLAAGTDAGVGVVDWSWSFGDGATRSGQQTTISFDAPGSYTAAVTATLADGTAVTDGLVLTVFDITGTSRTGPGGQELPALVGDADQDGQIGLGDAYGVVRSLEKFELLEGPGFLSADVDLDGSVTPTDVDLLVDAVLTDRTRPNRVLPRSAPPGQRITLISPELDDPLGVARVRVGTGQGQTIYRPVLGYGTFHIPLGTPPGPVKVRLLMDGIEVAGYELEVEPAVTSSSAPGVDLRRFIELSTAARAELALAVDDLLSTVGSSPEQRALSRAMLEVAEEQISANDQQTRTLIDMMDDASLSLIEQLANANGLQEALARLEETVGTEAGRHDLQGGAETCGDLVVRAQGPAPSGSSAGGTLVGDVAIEKLCRVYQLRDAISIGADAIGAGCDLAIGAAAISTFFIGPASIKFIIAFAAGCAAITAPLAIVEAVSELAGEAAAISLNVRATPPQAGTGGVLQSMVYPELNLAGLAGICQGGANGLVERLTELALEKLLTRVSGIKWVYRVLESVSGSLGEQALGLITSRLNAILGSALDGSAVSDLYLETVQTVCSWVNQFGLALPLSPADSLVPTPDPATGTLAIPPLGSTQAFATYTCDPQESSEVTVYGFREICGSAYGSAAQIQCNFGNVTITMGDNGTALDDIFAVFIDGEQVLTSNVPVTSTSTTVSLDSGDHSLEMWGLAAPDNVGTYFISITGATATFGTFDTGTDLVPGVVKSWTLTVP